MSQNLFLVGRPGPIKGTPCSTSRRKEGEGQSVASQLQGQELPQPWPESWGPSVGRLSSAMCSLSHLFIHWPDVPRPHCYSWAGARDKEINQTKPTCQVTVRLWRRETRDVSFHSHIC